MRLKMKRLFSKYIHSTCNPEEANSILKFLKKAASEQKIFKLMEPHWDRRMKESFEKPKSNPTLFKRIIKEISFADNQILTRKLKIYKLSLRIAAVLIVGLLIGSLVVFKSVPDYSQSLQSVVTPFGVRTNITFPDGSTGWINSGSNISYPGKFGKTRKVTLVGEAFFDVEKSSHPFIVSTQFGDITVKGTSFNVRAYPDEEFFEVTLVEGSVDVKKRNGKKSILLKPGEQAYLEDNVLKVKTINAKFYTSWKDGKIIFAREPFPNFIRKLERWYNIDIVYDDPRLNELWYSGTIEMETISEVMEMIGKAASVTYSYNSKNRKFTLSTK